MVCWELSFTNLLIEGSVRRALQKALAGGDIYVLVGYKKKKTSTKIFSIHCHMSEVVFSVWGMGNGCLKENSLKELVFRVDVPGFLSPRGKEANEALRVVYCRF